MSVHIEQEIKLKAPRRFSLAALAAGVNGFAASPVHAERLTTTYYDTDDLRLTRWGCSLRFRRGHGWTLKLYSAGSLQTRIEHNFEGNGAKPPGRALELVTAFLRGRPVQPVARLRTLRKSMRLSGSAGEEIAEVVDDDVRVMHDGHVADRFREIEVELLDGAPTATLDELKESLQEAGAGPSDDTPKNVRALGSAALASHELWVERPAARSMAPDMVRYSLASSVEKLLRADAPLRINMDPDSVHQARVATRRLRSDLRTFLPLLDTDWACALRQRIKWLTQELGAVRDADVLVARMRKDAARLATQDDRAADRVLDRFERECAAKRTRLATVLGEPLYVELLEELVNAATQPRLAPEAPQPACAVLAQLVAEPWKKLRKCIEEFGDDPGDDQLHRARIKAKRCRYAAEAVAPVGGKPVTRFAAKVEKLQTVLGDLHDAVVAQGRLREIQGKQDEVFVAGALAAMEAVCANRARRDWRKAWKKASKKSLRSWM